MTDDVSSVPPSLRNFLTVTEPDGSARTKKVTPSPLLSRLEAFLPEIARANSELVERPAGAPGVVVEKVASHERSSKLEKQGDMQPANASCEGDSAEEEEDLSVRMDLYVDNTLGKLVPVVENSDDEDDDASQGLIQELSDVESEGLNKGDENNLQGSK